MPAPRVVFDAMVFLQGAVSATGPAFACLRLAENDTVKLLLSPSTLAEVTDVLSRRTVRNHFTTLTDDRVRRFLTRVRSFTENLPESAAAFTLPRDPKDEIYINLAVAGSAEYLVSWNERHLNYLMKRDTPEGADFCMRYPDLKIVTPVEFLREIVSVP